MDQQPNASRRKQRQAGFTLIELMIVIAIVGGLVVIALPSLNDMIVNQKVKGLANELFFLHRLPFGIYAVLAQLVATSCLRSRLGTLLQGAYAS